jgi:hypothetical protein
MTIGKLIPAEDTMRKSELIEALGTETVTSKKKAE